MSLKEEKLNVFQELFKIVNEGLSNEDKLTGEMLRELKEKIDEINESDF